MVQTQVHCGTMEARVGIQVIYLQEPSPSCVPGVDVMEKQVGLERFASAVDTLSVR